MLQRSPEGKADPRIISGAAVATHRPHFGSICRVRALLPEQQRFKPPSAPDCRPTTTSRWPFQELKQMLASMMELVLVSFLENNKLIGLNLQ